MNRNRTGAGPRVDGPCIQMWMWQRGGVDTQIGRMVVFFWPACCLKHSFLFHGWLKNGWKWGGTGTKSFNVSTATKKHSAHTVSMILWEFSGRRSDRPRCRRFPKILRFGGFSG